MFNKRGKFEWGWIGWTVLILGVILAVIWLGWGNPFSSGPVLDSVGEEIKNAQGFDELLTERAKFLNYIFGKVPVFLIGWTSEPSAAIIIIGIWLLLLLAFGDILTLFSMFSKPIAWVIAVVLAIIAANLKAVMFMAVILLAVSAFLGAFAVVGGIGTAFVLFILFHWGTSKFRRRLMVRRAEDVAMRAVAGGAKVKGVIRGLGKIGEGLEEVGEKTK